MKTRLRQLGSSQAAIISSKILKEVGLEKGGEITITVKDKSIVIMPMRKSFFGVLPKSEASKLRAQNKKMREEWD